MPSQSAPNSLPATQANRTLLAGRNTANRAQSPHALTAASTSKEFIQVIDFLETLPAYQSLSDDHTLK